MRRQVLKVNRTFSFSLTQIYKELQEVRVMNAFSTTCLLFVLSNLLYFLYDRDFNDTQSALLIFAITLVQGVLMVIAYKTSLHEKLNLKLLIICAIISRLIVIPSSPILEDDFYRYLWDGHVLSHNINPYLYAPSSEQLDHLHTDYRQNIGYINVATIYPPLAQYIFAFNSLLGGGLTGLKIIFVIFDLLTALIIVRWLHLINQPISLSIFYLLNPIVIKEVANSAHLDSILAFFLATSFYLLDVSRLKTNFKKTFNMPTALAAISLSFATLIKVSPIFTLPAFLRQQKHWFKATLVMAVTTAVFFIPFMFADRLMPGMTSFAKHWVINESLFYPISYLATEIVLLLKLDQFQMVKGWLLNEIPGKLLSTTILAMIVFYYYFKKKLSDSAYALLIIVSLLLLSPVFNPWYTLWFLPLAIVNRHMPTIFLSVVLGLSYSYYLDRPYYEVLRLIEYLLFFGFLYHWHFLKKVVPKQSE